MEIGKGFSSLEDLARKLGIERQSARDPFSTVALFGVGVLVGAGLALLFAPTSGEKLRSEIGSRADDLGARTTGDGHSERDTSGNETGPAQA
jgi:hypothetical protein